MSCASCFIRPSLPPCAFVLCFDSSEPIAEPRGGSSFESANGHDASKMSSAKTKTKGKSGMNEVTLGVGLVLGLLVSGLIIAIVVFLLRRRRRRNSETFDGTADIAPRHLTRLERIALPETGADPNSIRQLRHRRWTSRHGSNGLTADEFDLVAPVHDFRPGRKVAASKEAGDALSATTTASASASEDGAVAEVPSKVAQVVDDEIDYTCSVCLDDMVLGDKTRTLRCNHEFHDECISAWVRYVV